MEAAGGSARASLVSAMRLQLGRKLFIVRFIGGSPANETVPRQINEKKFNTAVHIPERKLRAEQLKGVVRT